MNKQNNVSRAVLFLSSLAFILFVVYILYINQEVFYTAHDRSEFVFGAPFFNTLMSKPFGLMQYVGAWLTQFFCKPVVGSSILVVIWVANFIMGAPHESPIIIIVGIGTSLFFTLLWFCVEGVRRYKSSKPRC